MSYNFSGGGFMRYYVVRICDNDEKTVKILIDRKKIDDEYKYKIKIGNFLPLDAERNETIIFFSQKEWTEAIADVLEDEFFLENDCNLFEIKRVVL